MRYSITSLQVLRKALPYGFAFALGALLIASLPSVQAQSVPTYLYACKNLTTLVPRFVTTPSCVPIIEELVTWQQAPAPGTDLPLYCGGCSFQMVDFHGRNLTEAYLGSADLTEADLTETDLTDVDFVQATFYGALFANANLVNTNFTQADLTGAIGLASSTRTNVTWFHTTCPDGTNSNDHSDTCEGHLEP